MSGRRRQRSEIFNLANRPVAQAGRTRHKRTFRTAAESQVSPLITPTLNVPPRSSKAPAETALRPPRDGDSVLAEFPVAAVVFERFSLPSCTNSLGALQLAHWLAHSNPTPSFMMLNQGVAQIPLRLKIRFCKECRFDSDRPHQPPHIIRLRMSAASDISGGWRSALSLSSNGGRLGYAILR